MNKGLLKKAQEFCIKAHASQKRRNGEPYYNHPISVANFLNENFYFLIPLDDKARANLERVKEETIAAAYLHDVLEDTEYTRDDLLETGFPILVVEIVEAVTRKKNQNYLEYIAQILDSGPICRLAAAVKLADLWHNTNDGLPEGNTKDKYRLACYILTPTMQPMSIDFGV